MDIRPVIDELFFLVLRICEMDNLERCFRHLHAIVSMFYEVSSSIAAIHRHVKGSIDIGHCLRAELLARILQ